VPRSEVDPGGALAHVIEAGKLPLGPTVRRDRSATLLSISGNLHDQDSPLVRHGGCLVRHRVDGAGIFFPATRLGCVGSPADRFALVGALQLILSPI
jgi:hypothetical protein